MAEKLGLGLGLTLEGDFIAAATEEDVPVVVTVAGGRPVCLSVDVAV